MLDNFKISMLAASIIALLTSGASGVSAADNGAGPSKNDIINMCFNVGEACHDACDKAALTGSEWVVCDKGCDSKRDACVASVARQGKAATSKKQIKPKNAFKKPFN